ncbi:uroporphyrinogen decarboxylase, partial [mine drainage metagenome]
MGYRVEFEERVGPVISNDAGKQERIKYDVKNDRYSLYAGIKEFRHEHPSTFLYGFTGGPITLASYILAGGSDRDLTRTISSILKDRNAFRELTNDIFDMVISTAREQVRSGADAIQIFDSWSGSLPYSLFTDYVNDYLIPLSSELSSIPTVYFSTRTAGYAPLLTRTEFQYLSMDSRCRLSSMDEVFRSAKGLQGNLDPLYTTVNAEVAVSETQKILDDARNIDRYVFNLGHGVLPETST